MVKQLTWWKDFVITEDNIRLKKASLHRRTRYELSLKVQPAKEWELECVYFQSK